MHSPPLQLSDLPWLPRLGPDFKARLSEVTADLTAEVTAEVTADVTADVNSGKAADWGSALRALAQQALGLNQALALSKALGKLRQASTPPSLTPFKLGIVGNATLDFIVPFLQATGLRYGLALDVVTGGFDQPMQDALDPGSAINRCKPDAVLLALDHRGLPFRQPGAEQWPPYRAEQALSDLNAMRDGIRRHSGATCLVQTIPAPLTPLFGSLDASLPGSLRAAISAFNATLASSTAEQGDVLIDIDWVAQAMGLAQWHDDRGWHMARMAFSQRALPIYAEHVVRAIAALRGKARKCLVLDLDNTLWGGVIGDDGLDGIALNQGDARGEAHRAIQAAALDLRRRGIVLAVCSKNDEATARLPFQQHAGMLLKESDIAVFVANWEDKASNLERIAQRLDIGVDSLVFLDDNPVERLQVRQALPQVAVPELGDDPSTFVNSLLCAGYFESAAFTAEDLARADQYQGNAERAGLMESSRDLGAFLQSLAMTIQFAPFQAQGRKRITQLINKTNQFNVATRRYTEAQVAALETSGDHFTLQVGLVDRFGDNGMISAVICQRRVDEWEIDSWLMSCRVLSRQVEQSVCNHIARHARQAGAKRLLGTYIPTPRNHIVSDLFSRLGFVRIGSPGTSTSSTSSPDEAQHWLLDLETFHPFDVPIAESAMAGAAE